MKTSILFPALLLSLLGAGLPPIAARQAQEAYHWSTPQRIPDYFDMLRAPLLAADRRGTVHAFDMESGNGQEFVVMHRTWTPDGGWSDPVDVMLIPFLGVAPNLHSVYLDPAEELHLIYSAGTADGGQIYYTHVPIDGVAEAPAWSKPLELSTDMRINAPAAITGDGEGRLVIVYGGFRYGEGFYAVHSADDGDHWTEPRLLSRSREAGVFPGAVWVEMDEQGRAHTTWSTINDAGVGQEIRYGRLEPDLETWTGETVLASASGLDNLGWPSIVTSQEGLLLAYQDGFPPTRWIRRSTDDGASWSEPVRPFPHRGGYGFTSLVKDSLGNIHMVLGNRIQDPEIHGMWYSRLVGHRWLPLFPIISGPSTESFDPCCPQAVVSRGNLLLATWAHNVNQEHLTGAWYAYAYLPAPQIPDVAPAPEEAPTGPNRAQVGVAGEAAPTDESLIPVQATAGVEERTSPGGRHPASSIYLGIVPLLGALAWLYLRHAQARRSPPPSTDDRGGETKVDGR